MNIFVVEKSIHGKTDRGRVRDFDKLHVLYRVTKRFERFNRTRCAAHSKHARADERI